MIIKDDKDIIRNLNKTKQKDKITAFINSIPKQYKRDEYIIDKLKCNKKNVEK